MKLVRPGLLLLALLLVPFSVHAGTISLVLATRIIPGDAAIRVELDLGNQGDEAALNVVPTVEFQGRVVAGTPLEKLDPGQSQTVVFEVPLGGAVTPRGRWPVLVRVAYTDSTSRPLEAIHADVALLRSADPSPVQIDVAHAQVADRAQLTLRLDRAGVSESIRLAFAAPVGLLVDPRVVTHEPGASDTVRVNVSRAGAAAGSRLPLISFAEYDTPDGHQTALAVSMIDVVDGVEDVGGEDVRIRVIAGILGLTLLAWGVVAIIEARRRRRSTNVE